MSENNISIKSIDELEPILSNIESKGKYAGQDGKIHIRFFTDIFLLEDREYIDKLLKAYGLQDKVSVINECI